MNQAWIQLNWVACQNFKILFGAKNSVVNYERTCSKNNNYEYT